MEINVLLIKILFSFFISFFISFYLVPLFCSLAYTLKFVDVPDGKIKKHAQATPYLGGVAVYVGFLSGLALTMPFENRIFFLLVGITLLLLLGLIDDLVTLRPSQKFFGQFLVGLTFLKTGFYLKEHVFYNMWNMPLSLLWMLTIINAFNLIDVMDGLATSLAITAAIAFIAIAVYLQHIHALLLLTAFLGALIAFFIYNRPPARIYLGDAGSLFIGGFLAVIPFLFDWGMYNKIGYLTPCIILAIPQLECISLILIRSFKGIPFYKGSADHFSHYLISNGWSKNGVLWYVLILSCYLGISAFLFALGFISFTLTALLGLLFLLAWIAVLVLKRGK